MKKIIFTLLLGFTFIGFSQNTAIPDANFEQALIDLGIDTDATINGQVLTADIEGVTNLDVNNKNIADLTGIEGFIALTDLGCALNQLTSLDVSNNIALINLNCNFNQLTSIDVRNGNNTDIITFRANANPYLTCIFVDDVSYSTTNWTDIDSTSNFVADEAECDAFFTAIPDANFEQALIDLGIDTNPTIDGQVLTADIEGVTNLNVNNKNIADLTGIEGFTALTNLSCTINQLTSIDVSNNTALTVLKCSSNQLTSLNVSNNTVLTDLRLIDNQLTSLDVSANPALTILFCGTNPLTSLDLSNNIALTDLRCFNNQLTSLDVRNGNNENITFFNALNNPDLTCIFVDDVSYSDANWTDIDPASNFVADEAECDALFTVISDANFEQALIDLGIDTDATINGQVLTADIEGVTQLGVSSKNITDLTGIEGFTALTELICDGNQLTSLDVSNNTALTILYCDNNQLTSLDVSANTALTQLYCKDNLLTSLDVTNNTALTYLNCAKNLLSSIDVSNNLGLTDLRCFTNQLTSLDVSNNLGLTKLDCGDNLLTSLDVSANTALTQLYCRDNQLTSLDVSNNPALTRLRCFNNLLTSLNVFDNANLTQLICKNNQLTGSLNLSNNFFLTELQCQSNKIEKINIRNGNNDNVTNFNASTNPDLYCIVVDDIDYSTTNWTNRDPASTFVNNETDCEALSLVDNDFELDVTIYPNPTDNYLFIEGNVNPISITIYNLLGAKVIAKSNTDKIDVSELSKGVYIINISDGVSQTNRKFIKN